MRGRNHGLGGHCERSSRCIFGEHAGSGDVDAYGQFKPVQQEDARGDGGILLAPLSHSEARFDGQLRVLQVGHAGAVNACVEVA